MIREAEGKAQAIAEVQKATAEGLKYLNEAAPTESVLTLKSLEAFEKASDGTRQPKLSFHRKFKGLQDWQNP